MLRSAKTRFQLGLLVPLCALIIGVIVKLFIRPYVYHNQIEDYGVIGSLPSFLYVGGLCFAPLMLRRITTFSSYKLLLLAILGGDLTREFFQIGSDSEVFDAGDVVASLFGCALAFWFCRKYVFDQ